jgi:hypothetical protein
MRIAWLACLASLKGCRDSVFFVMRVTELFLVMWVQKMIVYYTKSI